METNQINSDRTWLLQELAGEATDASRIAECADIPEEDREGFRAAAQRWSEMYRVAKALTEGGAT